VVQGPARVLTKATVSAKQVALTFDAGADRGFALQILDTLQRENVVASFGLTGQWAERNADLVLRIANEGHVIINHTYDHASFTGLSTTGKPLTQQQRWAELDRAEQILTTITGRSTKPYFRPPYGDYDASVNRDVAARGYPFNVMWTVDSRGWMGLPAPQITARCLELAQPGAIYVFHVGAQSADAKALPDIISGLRAAGYSFVSVADFAQ
jgi:peptidoglycan/xylan/chitin deacetylase (PgdA/CDA1 family)